MIERRVISAGLDLAATGCWKSFAWSHEFPPGELIVLGNALLASLHRHLADLGLPAKFPETFRCVIEVSCLKNTRGEWGSRDIATGSITLWGWKLEQATQEHLVGHVLWDMGLAWDGMGKTGAGVLTADGADSTDGGKL